MRISAGSRGLSRNGGNIHVHPEIPFITIRPTIERPINQSVPPAPLEIRDAVFQELIRISPASNYMEELVAGPGGLLSRGLIQDDATHYGALPRRKQERATLAGILNVSVSFNLLFLPRGPTKNDRRPFTEAITLSAVGEAQPRFRYAMEADEHRENLRRPVNTVGFPLSTSRARAEITALCMEFRC
jgi:hypothetical protein